MYTFFFDGGKKRQLSLAQRGESWHLAPGGEENNIWFAIVTYEIEISEIDGVLLLLCSMQSFMALFYVLLVSIRSVRLIESKKESLEFFESHSTKGFCVVLCNKIFNIKQSKSNIN